MRINSFKVSVVAMFVALSIFFVSCGKEIINEPGTGDDNEIEESISVTGVTVNKKVLSLVVGEEYQLIAEILPSNSVLSVDFK